jgi:hypothetical protein
MTYIHRRRVLYQLWEATNTWRTGLLCLSGEEDAAYFRALFLYVLGIQRKDIRCYEMKIQDYVTWTAKYVEKDVSCICVHW